MSSAGTSDRRAEWHRLLGDEAFSHWIRFVRLTICLIAGTPILFGVAGGVSVLEPPASYATAILAVLFALYVGLVAWQVREVVAAQFAAARLYGLSRSRGFKLNMRSPARFEASLHPLPGEDVLDSVDDWRVDLGEDARSLLRRSRYLYTVAFCVLFAGAIIGFIAETVAPNGWIAAPIGAVAFFVPWWMGRSLEVRARAAAAEFLEISPAQARSLSVASRDHFVASLRRIRLEQGDHP